VAAPDPLGAAHTDRVAERRRLRIVDEDDVVVGFKELCALPVDVQINRLVRLRERVCAALQGVVKRLGDREEVRRALDEPPVRLDAERIRQRNVPREQLRDTATEPGRVDVADADAVQLAR
jgi:hypothetical protein